MQKQTGRRGVVMVPAPTVRNPAVEEFCGKNDLLIKDCSSVRTSGGFSSGTFKDYRSCRLVNDFGERNPVLYSIVYTTAGYSLGNIAIEYNKINGIPERAGVVAVSIIDEELDPRIKGVLAACSVLAEVPLQRRIFTRGELLDVVRGIINNGKRECLDAENYAPSYAKLAQEIIDERPDAVFMPLGGGEAAYSALLLLGRLKSAGIKVPKLFASTIRANIFAGETAPGEQSLAEKLVTPHSELFEKIMRILPRHGEIIIVEENEIMPAYLALKEAGLRAEPSAAVAFAAARKTRLPRDKAALIVNSGTGIYFDENGILRGV